MRINTNVASLNAQENATNTNKTLSSSLEKLSSGLRINKAADDASGLAIADKLRTQASSLNQGVSNANSASALIQIADKAMSEQSNILDTVKTKLIQASTSTTSADGREAIRKDVSKLLEQFDNIASQTNYNGVTLLQGSTDSTAKAEEFAFQLGESSEFDVKMTSSVGSNTDQLGGGTDTFGASSINSNITAGSISAANGLNGAQFGTGTVTDNNIGVSGSQVIHSSVGLSLTATDVSVNATGVVGEKAAADGLDVTFSGDLGSITVANAGATLDISNETQAVKDAVLAIVNADGNLDMNLEGQVSFAAGGSSDFNGIEFSAAKFEDSTAGAKLKINVTAEADAKSVTIRNNQGANDTAAGNDVTPLLGQINIETLTAPTNTMTGGRMLSDLKNLEEGGLTGEIANDFMESVDVALTDLNALRSDFGSTQNQLESSIRNMQTTHTNLKNAESVIRDTDFALESASFNKQNIIAQAGTYAMSQANSMAQNVQKLLQ